ncbi:protein FAM149A [Hoplias malabaricus]|uniref:protein FAM149A n=1 Tax=Hoplias malabaricus TaxID=27720 RepID=UPI00346287D0
MQVSVELARPSDCVSARCHGPFIDSPRAQLPESLRPSPESRSLKIRCPLPVTMSSNAERELSLKKKLLKEPDRYICSVSVQLTRSTDRDLSSDQSVSGFSRSTARAASPESCLTSCSDSTGFSTEHSSIYSWRYDEFDRANTQHVRQLFSALDELLYEGKLSSKSETLQKECEEWNKHSPHLRILGNQLEPPKQEGVQYIHRRATSARMIQTPPCLDKREDNSELCVEGHKLAPGPWSDLSVYSRLPLSGLSLSHMNQEEEVYEVEGRIEEFLAYDEKEMENEGVDQTKVLTAAPRDGVPPVSPKACIRDAVADELFDDVWKEVVGLLEDLLHKHWDKQNSASDGLKQRRTLENSSQIFGEPSSHLLSRGHHVSLSRGLNSRSTLLLANTSNIQDSSVLKINLNGVMTIQAKPLQQRQQGFGERSLCDSEDGANSFMCLKAQGQRGMSSRSQKPPSQRTLPRLNIRARLRQNLPSQSTQVLRGNRLSTVAEDFLSSPVSAVQNHRLPLIHMESNEQDWISPVQKVTNQLRGRIMRGGVTSGMQAVSSLPPLRDPTLLLETLSRPNTTHTFRSDTSLKSSLTPMDFASNLRMGRGLLAGDISRTGHGTPMGVTGFSITCSTSSGFSECITPPKRHTHLLSSTDAQGQNTSLLGSIGPRKALNRFPVPVRKKFQVLLS